MDNLENEKHLNECEIMYPDESIDIGMSGNRNGMSEEAKHTLQELLNDILEQYNINTVHHGDCVGSDFDFHKICSNFNIPIVIHPPNVDSMRAFCKSDVILKPKPFLERNKSIVNTTDMLIAFPSTKEELLRSGTWSTIRYARKTNKKVILIYSDGSIVEE